MYIRHDGELAKVLGDLRLEVRNDSALSNDALEIFDELASNAKQWTVTDKATGAKRLDSQTMLYAVRQLEFVMEQVYEEDFPALRMAEGELVPINSNLPDGAESFTYYLYNATGIARFSSAYTSRTAPRTYARGAKVTGTVEGLEAGYGYSMRDIRAAEMANDPLEMRLASADRRAHEELLNSIGLWGREDRGLPGLINHPNINVIDAAPAGTPIPGLIPSDFRAKSNDEILEDFANLIDFTDEATFGMRQANRVLMSRRVRNLLKRRRLGAGDGLLSLFDFLRDNYDGSDGTTQVEFEVLNELKFEDSEGNLAADALFAYIANDSRLLELIVPMPYTQHPLQQQGLEIQVPTESSTGGIRLVEPQICTRMDGVWGPGTP